MTVRNSPDTYSQIQQMGTETNDRSSSHDLRYSPKLFRLPDPPIFHLVSTFQAEQYRSMGQKRRQLREELERREKGVVNGVRSGGSGSVCLGAGGEARLVSELKKRGEEMRKRQGREREQKRREQEAAMESEFERASAKKRRDGSNDDDYDFEDRTVRVKWSTKKESHSDHTLDVLFSRFGVVELVSIEAGTGNKALVTFALPTAADAAVAHFNEDHETMRASHASKKKRAKRNSFAPRRESFMSPPGTPMSEGGGSVASTPSSLRDKESLVMMKLRREAERQALIRQMAADEGISVEQAGGSKPPPVSPAVATPSGASRTNSQRNASANGDTNGKEADRDEAGNGESTATEGGETNQRAAAAAVGVVNCSTSNLEVGGDGGAGIGERGKEQQLKQPTSSSVSPTGTNSIRSSTVTPVFPYPSPRTPAAGVGRDSAKLSSMKRGVAGSSPLSTPIGAGIGFNTRMGVNSAGADDMRRVSTPTVMAAGGSTPSSSAGESPLDEGDILARMMRFK